MPGLLHDHCSAFRPMAVGSPFLNSLGLDRYGLSWRWAEIDCAHPLDNGDARLLYRSTSQRTTCGFRIIAISDLHDRRSLAAAQHQAVPMALVPRPVVAPAAPTA